MMSQPSRTVLDQYQVRKTKKQKEGFRAWLCGELEQAGYVPVVEKGNFSHNIVVGDPEKAEVLFTAHYDTQPVLPIPNFITPRNMGWYLLYQFALVAFMFAAALLAEVGCLLAVGAVLGEIPVWFIPLPAYLVCLFCVWWLFFGKANKHTANDNTSGVLTLLETALALPEADRDKVCFVFFDNEEKGMLGSLAFSAKHLNVKKNTLVVNFDCVSDGDHIQFFPSRGLKRDPAAMERLEKAFRGRGEKSVELVRGFGFYPSDNTAFKRSAGVCALHRNKVFGYYMSRIHTGRDTVLEEENILLLRDGALRLIQGEPTNGEPDRN